ncbi:GerAB/ArcD/ProY family transporter [Fictibacillus barbaricus]|uniref:GerAB/ArcD/ProY family transporter n=1 Tax=Fictibacillus barbaricus TaxID=182136 RepID=A0ABS2ZBZ8_9BACL|nr:GerAB/ArcD/ProY family transporter [Fictibacillus barbaricus]
MAVISLPYDVFHKSKTDSWLSIILSGIVVQLLIVLIWLMAKKYPNSTLFGITGMQKRRSASGRVKRLLIRNIIRTCLGVMQTTD